ncbi:uncharacterized protein JCM6883_007532 [Sporobolomyces salmoneus]|uniref:uncharacterized protein n=1 Tax=Sporobolomyces salmoneus TaxID=183962 RepID=UPI0031792AEB
MLSLPTELITGILLLSLPSPSSSRFVSSTYQDRVSLLSTFSLICHAFHEIVEPLLYSTFWARNERQFDAFIEAVESKQNAHLVQRVVLDGSMGGISESRVSRAATILTEVQELSLHDLSLGNLNKLNGFQKLEVLILETVSHGEKDVFTLPSLRQLTVGYDCIIDLSLITDATAPRLSGLALRRFSDLDVYPFTSNTAGNLHITYWIDEVMSGGPRRSLVDSGFRHFRFYRLFEPAPLEDAIDSLIVFVCEKSSVAFRLDTLLLPPPFDPESHDLQSEHLQKRREKAQELIDKCIANGVDLILEEGTDGRYNSDVSEAFLEKMERLARARQQTEIAETEEEEEKNDH